MSGEVGTKEETNTSSSTEDAFPFHELPESELNAILELVASEDPLSRIQPSLSSVYDIPSISTDPMAALLLTSPSIAAQVIQARSPDRFVLTFLRDLFSGDQYYLSMDLGARVLRWLHRRRPALLPRKVLITLIVFQREGEGQGIQMSGFFDYAPLLAGTLLAPSAFIAACENQLHAVNFLQVGAEWNRLWSKTQGEGPLQLRHLSIGARYVDSVWRYSIQGLRELTIQGPFSLSSSSSFSSSVLVGSQQLDLTAALAPFKQHRIAALNIEIPSVVSSAPLLLSGLADDFESPWSSSLTSLRLLVGHPKLYATVQPDHPPVLVLGLSTLTNLERLQGPFSGSDQVHEMIVGELASLRKLRDLTVGRWSTMQPNPDAAQVESRVLAGRPLRTLDIASLQRLGTEFAEFLPWELQVLTIHHGLYDPEELPLALPTIGQRLSALRELRITLEMRPLRQKDATPVILDLSDCRSLSIVQLQYDRFVDLSLVLPPSVRHLRLASNLRTREELLGQLRVRHGTSAPLPERPCIPPNLVSLDLTCCPWRSQNPDPAVGFEALLAQMSTSLRFLSINGAAEIQDLEEGLAVLRGGDRTALSGLITASIQLQLTQPPTKGYTPTKEERKRQKQWQEHVDWLVEEWRGELKKRGVRTSIVWSQQHSENARADGFMGFNAYGSWGTWG